MWPPWPSGYVEVLKVKLILKSPVVVRYPKVPKYMYHVSKHKTIKGESSYIQEQKNKL